VLKSIYNWIRYKTITPSFYAKNRLFIERGDKHRRIFSNLGLVFRNSKWASYVKENLSFSSYSSTLSSWRNTLLIITLFSIILLIPSYLWPTEIQEWTFAQLWYLVDEFARTSVLVVFTLYWNVTQRIEELVNTVLNVSKEKQPLGSALHVDNQKSKKLTKRDKKDLVYWLTNESNLINDSQLTEFYRSSATSTYSNLFTTYMKVFNPSNITNNYSHSSLWHDYNLENITQPYPSFNVRLPLVLSLTRPSVPSSNLHPKSSLWLLDHNSKWNLDSISSSNSTSTYINSVIGQYILSSRDLSQSYTSSTKNSLLLPLTPSLKEQTNWIKVSRWLSRYSILHRRTIADSHKLTMAKRLIGSGFYNSSLDTLNINNSSIKALSSDWSALYQSLFSQSYGNFFDPYTNSQLVSTKNASELAPKFSHLLSFHEDSLSWVTKRFYLFNNLSTNSNNYSLRLNFDDLKLTQSVTPEHNMDNFLSLQRNALPHLPYSTTKQPITSEYTPLLASEHQPLNPFVIYDTKEELFSLDYTESAMLMLQKPSYSSNQQLVWGTSLNLTDSSYFNPSVVSPITTRGLVLSSDYKSWEDNAKEQVPFITYHFVNGPTLQEHRSDFWQFVRSQTPNAAKLEAENRTFLKRS
jgi:hypothetical protein